jgi:G3E family GTPase
MAERVEAARVPVTVLTGFLGSGKTTLLNHILTATHGKKIAIIENEFGEVSIDDALVVKNDSRFQSDEEIIEVLNGCICCSVRQDLITILKKLAARSAAGEIHLDAIVIETTGMADPAPVAQVFLIDEAIKAFAFLDGIVTLVDAKHIEQHLDEEKPAGVVNEAVSQVAFADRLLLNKTDLVSQEELMRVEARLKTINHFAPVVRCQHSEVSVERVLGIHGFDLQRALHASPQLLDASATPTKHDASVTSVSLDQGAARHLRKGVKPGDVDLDLIEGWFKRLLADAGQDLFRMKGVLAIAHATRPFVYHAVHMTFEGAFSQEWSEGEPRLSKLVFIGRNLDASALAASFNACLATTENLQKKADALRFAIGDRVVCKVPLRGSVAAARWVRGSVVAHNFRDEAMPPGVVAPYRVKLDRGRGLVWPTADCDQIIRDAAPRRRSSKGRKPKADASSDASSSDAQHTHTHTHDHGHEGDHDHDHDHDHEDDMPFVGGVTLSASSGVFTRLTANALARYCLRPLARRRVHRCMRASHSLYAQRQYREAIAVAETAREIACSRVGVASRVHARTLLHLAATHAACQHEKEALALLSEAETLALTLHGEGCLQLVPVLHGQAEVYEAAGRFAEAAGALERVLHVRRAALGAAHAACASSASNLASLLAKQADAEGGGSEGTWLRVVELGVEASKVAEAAGDAEKAEALIEGLLSSVEGRGEGGDMAEGVEAKAPGREKARTALQERLAELWEAQEEGGGTGSKGSEHQDQQGDGSLKVEIRA